MVTNFVIVPWRKIGSCVVHLLHTYRLPWSSWSWLCRQLKHSHFPLVKSACNLWFSASLASWGRAGMENLGHISHDLNLNTPSFHLTPLWLSWQWSQFCFGVQSYAHITNCKQALPRAESVPTTHPLLFYSLFSMRWWKPVLESGLGDVSGCAVLCVKPNVWDMGAVYSF